MFFHERHRVWYMYVRVTFEVKGTLKSFAEINTRDKGEKTCHITGDCFQSFQRNFNVF